MPDRPRRLNPEALAEADLVTLLKQPAFKRFLLRVVTASGMHDSAYGSVERNLHQLEGRRSLGFDVLAWCDDALRLPPRSALRMALNQDEPPPGETDDDDDDPFPA